MMYTPQRSFQAALTTYNFYLLWVSIVTGVRAGNIKYVCPKEMVQLDCDPQLEQAIQSGDFKELSWTVNDLRNKSEFGQTVAYCNEYLFCNTDDHFGKFEKRIKMKKYPDNGVLNVEQLNKDDFLTFTCLVKRKDRVVYHQMHLNSSVTSENCPATTSKRNYVLLLVIAIFGFTILLVIMWVQEKVISQRTYTLSLDTDVQISEFRSSSENFLTEIGEENPVQNLETEPLMALEEKPRGKDFQMAISQDYGEEESAKLQEQLRGKREEVAELERELNDREQDYIKLQRDLCETKEKLTKCESLLTTREWLISRDEIEIMREKFLGEGSYGKVFKGRYRGFVVAVKELKCLSTFRERDLFEREMDIASRCRHPCLLQFIGATQDEKTPLFVTELMESSLRKLLEKRQLSEKEIAVISLDVAHALNYLHQRKPKAIVHRDVSSANVLLWKQNGEWRGKLGDYGTVKFLQEIMTVAPGAMIYGAPEVGCPHNQTVKIDVYSFGVLLCEMCTRKLPVLENREEQVRLVSNTGFAGLILWCVEEDPMMRPSMEEVIKKVEEIKDVDSELQNFLSGRLAI